MSEFRVCRAPRSGGLQATMSSIFSERPQCLCVETAGPLCLSSAWPLSAAINAAAHCWKQLHYCRVEDWLLLLLLANMLQCSHDAAPDFCPTRGWNVRERRGMPLCDEAEHLAHSLRKYVCVSECRIWAFGPSERCAYLCVDIERFVIPAELPRSAEVSTRSSLPQLAVEILIFQMRYSA